MNQAHDRWVTSLRQAGNRTCPQTQHGNPHVPDSPRRPRRPCCGTGSRTRGTTELDHAVNAIQKVLGGFGRVGSNEVDELFTVKKRKRERERERSDVTGLVQGTRPKQNQRTIERENLTTARIARQVGAQALQRSAGGGALPNLELTRSEPPKRKKGVNKNQKKTLQPSEVTGNGRLSLTEGGPARTFPCTEAT
jgi:hypothetical protein